ncbi:MAG: RagB/SusD family nutrient uptake outer membrane protein [Prevotella sp.]
MRHNIFFCAIALMVTTTTMQSCDDYLDVLPSKSTSLPVTTVEQLDAMLANYSDFCDEYDLASLCCHDDFEFPIELYDAVPMFFSSPNSILRGYLWDYDNLADANADTFWSGNGNKTGEYTKLFRANMVLDYIDNVEGSNSDKQRLIAEAHFIRAYSTWNLAQEYCLPYSSRNLHEPGIPLKRSTSFEESSVRATLEETYAFIESELEEALKCNTPLMQDGIQKIWRANTAAINGFAARFYLSINNYSKALEHAEKALNEHSRLVDYNTEVNCGDNLGFGLNFPSTFLLDNYDFTGKLSWGESLYFRTLTAINVDMMFFPSRSLMELYDKDHDLRYMYHFQHEIIPIMYRSSYPYPVYLFWTLNQIPSGPSTAEMILIKAECQARQNDWQQALATVNQLRAKRMVPGSWVEMKASSREEAIRNIIDERRREMPFAQRWHDIRRYNNNDEAFDDVQTVSRTFYEITTSSIINEASPITYTLEKDSRKYALPINNKEIELSNGQIKQNIY